MVIPPPAIRPRNAFTHCESCDCQFRKGAKFCAECGHERPFEVVEKMDSPYFSERITKYRGGITTRRYVWREAIKQAAQKSEQLREERKAQEAKRSIWQRFIRPVW